jgi:hypothetical protein
MKPLNKLLLLCLLMGLLPMLQAQSNLLDYYEITANKDRYYDSLRSALPDTVKIAGMKDYQR